MFSRIGSVSSLLGNRTNQQRETQHSPLTILEEDEGQANVTMVDCAEDGDVETDDDEWT